MRKSYQYLTLSLFKYLLRMKMHIPLDPAIPPTGKYQEKTYIYMKRIVEMYCSLVLVEKLKTTWKASDGKMHT